MKPVSGHRPANIKALMTLAMMLGAVVSTLSQAQGVYRIVGPDGKVSYSDQPPPANNQNNAAAKPVVGGPSTSAAAAAGYMPPELKQAMGRYPVVFYAGKDCAPCDTGRNYLNGRGVPYTEKTVNTNDDAAALKRLSGTTSLPMLSIGSQQIKGYSEVEWTQYLDAAGYPKKSALSATYRRPAPSPLVEAKPVDTAAAATPSRKAPKPADADAPAEVPVTPPVTTPGGIRF
ncbi:glutaredoxin family protein [Hydrogenophaga sp. RWCD_12]|uniref:glutaredoxin family protein n=1 Tax=Hydrogenophaga sp. RWCD_12 TaxID=3391190 RepID=UPI0039855C54